MFIDPAIQDGLSGHSHAGVWLHGSACTSLLYTSVRLVQRWSFSWFIDAHPLYVYKFICICMYLYTNTVQQQSALWLWSMSCMFLPCYIRDGAICTVHSITHVILVHKSTVMLFQAISTCISSSNSRLLLLGSACKQLLILAIHQPQQSLPTDLSQISVGNGSKPYCNKPYWYKPYCNKPCCKKPVPWAILCCNTEHILLCWHHTIQSFRLSSIIRHKGAIVIEDSRAHMCDIYTGCFIKSFSNMGSSAKELAVL